MIFVNFKTYEQGTGAKAADLVRILSECEAATGVPIIPVVQTVDLRLCLGFSSTVWVQHVDGISYGHNTGWILSEAVIQAGAKGTFLNHSEHRLGRAHVALPAAMVGQISDLHAAVSKLEDEFGREPTSEEVAKELNIPASRVAQAYAAFQEVQDGDEEEFDHVAFEQLKVSIERCKAVGLDTVVFAQDQQELARVVGLSPTYVAYEPPELIASKDTSVAKAEPKIIREVSQIANAAGVPLIVGAGVKDAQDVRVSIELGAVGVAVSSAIMLSDNPKREVLELIEGLR